MQKRHHQILDALAECGLLTVDELVARTGSSPATIRRDLNRLDAARKLRKVRGGGEPLEARGGQPLTGSSFRGNVPMRVAQKRAIARRAVALCRDSEPIIVNGGTTTFRMAEFMAERQMQVLTNSFAMADQLLRHTSVGVTLPGGEVYREQNIILSPYDNDTAIDHFYASKVFSGAYALRPHGMIETDPLLIKAEQKLIRQAEELIVLADSSKFDPRGSLILCPLEQIGTVITDSGVRERDVRMLEEAGASVIIAREDDQAADVA